MVHSYLPISGLPEGFLSGFPEDFCPAYPQLNPASPHIAMGFPEVFPAHKKYNSIQMSDVQYWTNIGQMLKSQQPNHLRLLLVNMNYKHIIKFKCQMSIIRQILDKC